MRKLGIILAGGKSSRLYPATLVTTKQLLPVYDKPLIYYPLTTLMLAGIKDYVIISSPLEIDHYKRLFSNHLDELGINITFAVQENSIGIADAFRITKNILGDKVFDFDSHCLILGDNIFYGAGFSGQLKHVDTSTMNIFVHQVPNAKEFGVAELEDDKVISLEEKPENPKSNLAVTGLYFYPNDVYIKVQELTPSARGELEITDLNKIYLNEGKLSAVKLSRGVVWFDTGTSDSLLEAANFIQTLQKHQGVLVGSPHEVAINKRWTTKEKISSFILKCNKTFYGQYLSELYDTKK
jgi:glucose-1-phosphate thymidylyltransferase